MHSQKKHPRTNLPDPARVFEFWANHPQSLHQMTILMSDRGIPRSWRHMNGYGSHTLGLWNAQGERFWVDCRTCAKGLGHDPFILRRCSAFRVISPQYRIRLPPEAFERGWRERYGTEEHMLGTDNAIEP